MHCTYYTKKLQGWQRAHYTVPTWPAPPAPATPTRYHAIDYHPRPASQASPGSPAPLKLKLPAGSHWPVPLKCRLKLQPVIRRLQWQWQLLIPHFLNPTLSHLQTQKTICTPFQTGDKKKEKKSRQLTYLLGYLLVVSWVLGYLEYIRCHAPSFGSRYCPVERNPLMFISQLPRYST